IGYERADVLLDVLVAERVRRGHVRRVAEARGGEREVVTAADERAAPRRLGTKKGAGLRRKHRQVVRRRLPRPHELRMAGRTGGRAGVPAERRGIGRCAATEQPCKDGVDHREENRLPCAHRHDCIGWLAKKHLTPRTPRNYLFLMAWCV